MDCYPSPAHTTKDALAVGEAMPIMDDGMTNQLNHNLRTIAVICCALLCVTFAGCQPQTRNTGGLFGLGNQGTFNTADSTRSAFASQNAPFTPSSPFGTFSQSNGAFQVAGSDSRSSLPAASTNYDPSGLGQLGQPGIAQQYGRIQQQLGAYDADNQLLNTEVATLQQKLELSNQYNQTLKQQLADTSDRISQTGNQTRIDQQQFASLQQQIQTMQQRIAQQETLLGQQERLLADRGPDWQGSSTFQNSGFRREDSGSGSSANLGSANLGSATLRANNGLMQKINAINIPGGDARMDGDIIRVEFPTDRLFTNGSYRIQASQLPLLQNVASTIRQSFPRQIVGIEAHWDGTPLSPSGTTAQQLTATQSLAVFDELVRLGLPREQLFTMAMGSNRPRHRAGLVAGISPNRRIELVIYPESYDAR